MYDNKRPWFVETDPLTCSTLIGANHPIRLLIVEDVREDAELIILTLEHEGISFEADVIDCLESCADYLTTHQYDVILSDYQLINGTAYQVLELVQKLHQDIPVILVTGILGDEAAVDCIKAGITNYVLKDNLVRLPMVLAQSLQESALRQQRHIALKTLQEQAFQPSAGPTAEPPE